MTLQELPSPNLCSARDRLRETLPETLMAALDAYDAFAARTVPDDAKDFGAWQGGCKAVLAHVELLLKLAARVGLDLDPSPTDDGEEAALSALLARAREAMASAAADAPDADDEEAAADGA